MDIERALTDFCQDPRASWKVGVGMFVVSLPMLHVAAVGYQVQVARDAWQGRAGGLPEWDDPGRWVRQGMGLAAVRSLYELPGALILLGTLVVAGPWLTAVTAGPGGLAALLPAGAVLGSGLLLWWLYGATEGLLWAAVMAQYVRHGHTRACFDFGAVLGLIGQHSPDYLVSWVLKEAARAARDVFALAFGLVLFFFIPWYIGPLLSFLVWGWLRFMAMLLGGHLVGQMLHASDARTHLAWTGEPCSAAHAHTRLSNDRRDHCRAPRVHHRPDFETTQPRARAR